MQITVDAFVAGTNGEMDWMVQDWDDELKNYVNKITEPADCILLGRKLAEGFIPTWASKAANPDDPEFTAGKNLRTHKKLFLPKRLTSQTGTTPFWQKAILPTKSLN